MSHIHLWKLYFFVSKTFFQEILYKWGCQKSKVSLMEMPKKSIFANPYNLKKKTVFLVWVWKGVIQLFVTLGFLHDFWPYTRTTVSLVFIIDHICYFWHFYRSNITFLCSGYHKRRSYFTFGCLKKQMKTKKQTIITSFQVRFKFILYLLSISFFSQDDTESRICMQPRFPHNSSTFVILPMD